MINKLIITNGLTGEQGTLTLSNEPIKYNKNVCVIGDISALSSDITQTMIVPKTPDNIKTLGFLGLNNDIIGKQLTGVLIDNGLPTFRDAIVHNIQNKIDSYSIVLKQGNTNFIEQIEGLTLQDLDFSDLLELWNISNILSFRTNTEGIIYPIIQSGNYSGHIGYYVAEELFPAVYFKTIFEKIVDKTGWQIISDIFQTESFLKRVLFVSDWAANDLIRDRCKARGRSTTILNLVDVDVRVLSYQTIDYDYYNAIEAGTYVSQAGDAYICKSAGLIDIYAYVEYQKGGERTADIELMKNQTVIASKNILEAETGTGSFTANLTSFEVSKGDFIYIKIRNAALSTLTVNTDPAILQITNVQFQKTGVDLEFPISENMPAIKLTDFIKDFIGSFNIIPVADIENKIVTFHSFDEISENINKGDILELQANLIAERSNINIQNEYKIDGYGKVNYFNYTLDKLDGLPENYARGEFSLIGQNYFGQFDIYKSIFAASKATDIIYPYLIIPFLKRESEGTGADVKYNVSQNDKIEPRIAYMTLQDWLVILTDDGGQTFTTLTTDIPIAKFDGFLDGNTIIANFFSTFIASLKNPSTPTLRMFIPYDKFFNSFDPLKPLFFNGQYYLITNIEGYEVKKGEGTFKLIQINQA